MTQFEVDNILLVFLRSQLKIEEAKAQVLSTFAGHNGLSVITNVAINEIKRQIYQIEKQR